MVMLAAANLLVMLASAAGGPGIVEVAAGSVATPPAVASLGLRRSISWPLLLLAWGEKRFAIERLDPLTRVKVLAALTGLVILMFGMMLLAWLGARWARHYANQAPRLFEDREKRPKWSADDWASKPLSSPASPEEEESPGPS